jgi:hypothetical protein
MISFDAARRGRSIDPAVRWRKPRLTRAPLPASGSDRSPSSFSLEKHRILFVGQSINILADAMQPLKLLKSQLYSERRNDGPFSKAAAVAAVMCFFRWSCERCGGHGDALALQSISTHGTRLGGCAPACREESPPPSRSSRWRSMMAPSSERCLPMTAVTLHQDGE